MCCTVSKKEVAGEGFREPSKDHFLQDLVDCDTDFVLCSEDNRRTVESFE